MTIITQATRQWIEEIYIFLIWTWLIHTIPFHLLKQLCFNITTHPCKYYDRLSVGGIIRVIKDSFHFNTSRKLTHILALISGCSWLLLNSQNLRISQVRHFFSKQELDTMKTAFSCCLLTKMIPNLLLWSYKADYFINGTGCIGQQRHIVLLHIITVYKRQVSAKTLQLLDIYLIA